MKTSISQAKALFPNATTRLLPLPFHGGTDVRANRLQCLDSITLAGTLLNEMNEKNQKKIKIFFCFFLKKLFSPFFSKKSFFTIQKSKNVPVQPIAHPPNRQTAVERRQQSAQTVTNMMTVQSFCLWRLAAKCLNNF
jgi:hypothetical protein